MDRVEREDEEDAADDVVEEFADDEEAQDGEDDEGTGEEPGLDPFGCNPVRQAGPSEPGRAAGLFNAGGGGPARRGARR